MARSGVFTRALVTCLAVTSAVHAAIYLVNAVLPLHLVALGGSKTQVGLLFSVATVVSMFLRPLVGGWNDRFGFRAVVLPGTVVLAASVVALLVVEAPAAVIALMLGMGLGNGLISTSAGVLASRATAPEHRGEALSIYYVATASALAIGPPLGFALYGAAGMRASLLVAAALVCVVGPLAWSLRERAAAARARRAPRLHPRQPPRARGRRDHDLDHYRAQLRLRLLAAVCHRRRHGQRRRVVLHAVLGVAHRVPRPVSPRVGPARTAARRGRVHRGDHPRVRGPRLASERPVARRRRALARQRWALLYPTMVALLVDRTPEAERGLAIGTLSGSWDVGVVIGSLIIGVTVERVSYAAGFLVAGAASIAGLAAFVVTRRVVPLVSRADLDAKDRREIRPRSTEPPDFCALADRRSVRRKGGRHAVRHGDECGTARCTPRRGRGPARAIRCRHILKPPFRAGLTIADRTVIHPMPTHAGCETADPHGPRPPRAERARAYRGRVCATLAVALVLIGACATLPKDYPRPESTAFLDHESTAIGKEIAALAAQHPGESAFALIRHGRQAFTARVALADLAQRALDVQYFLWETDATGRILADRLMRAADRGVRVRVLIDDVNLKDRDAGIAALDAHPNVEIRLFNPFAASRVAAARLRDRLQSRQSPHAQQADGDGQRDGHRRRAQHERPLLRGGRQGQLSRSRHRRGRPHRPGAVPGLRPVLERRMVGADRGPGRSAVRRRGSARTGRAHPRDDREGAAIRTPWTRMSRA